VASEIVGMVMDVEMEVGMGLHFSG